MLMLVALNPYRITRLLTLMPVACQELVFWIGKMRLREEKLGKESLIYKVGIRVKSQLVQWKPGVNLIKLFCHKFTYSFL